jgi:hypothetical protein
VAVAAYVAGFCFAVAASAILYLPSGMPNVPPEQLRIEEVVSQTRQILSALEWYVLLKAFSSLFLGVGVWFTSDSLRLVRGASVAIGIAAVLVVAGVRLDWVPLGAAAKMELTCHAVVFGLILVVLSSLMWQHLRDRRGQRAMV